MGMKKFKKALFALFILGMVVGGSYWFYKEVTKPMPGEFVEDLGREHVPDGAVISYNSNPPTSGPHYEQWAKAGVYQSPVPDGYLVHSLEHGYVIISYNCEIQAIRLLVKPLLAHEETLESTQSANPDKEEKLGGVWESEECKRLVENMTEILEERKKRKLILVPRLQLDTRIALTAWTRIDKFNEFDRRRIIEFIDAFRDRGPEQTME